jgi:hypothetical protein
MSCVNPSGPNHVRSRISRRLVIRRYIYHVETGSPLVARPHRPVFDTREKNQSQGNNIDGDAEFRCQGGPREGWSTQCFSPCRPSRPVSQSRLEGGVTPTDKLCCAGARTRFPIHSIAINYTMRPLRELAVELTLHISVKKMSKSWKVLN